MGQKAKKEERCLVCAPFVTVENRIQKSPGDQVPDAASQWHFGSQTYNGARNEDTVKPSSSHCPGPK